MNLDKYEVISANGMIGVLCRRCLAVLFTARDMNGDQSGLTLAELVEQAVEHEDIAHGGGS